MREHRIVVQDGKHKVESYMAINAVDAIKRHYEVDPDGWVDLPKDGRPPDVLGDKARGEWEITVNDISCGFTLPYRVKIAIEIEYVSEEQ
jgi:hypothetical protein